ncbi:MAG: hypothetical protein ACE5FC_07360 [Myxococcota bacterium]
MSFEESTWVRSLLDDGADAHADPYQLIYSLHNEDPEAPIDELYRRATGLVRAVLRDGLMSMVEVTYRNASDDERVLVAERLLSADEAEEKIDDPWIWDRANTDCDTFFALSTTEKGMAFLDSSGTA